MDESHSISGHEERDSRLREENESLRAQLEEARETLRAIREGEVDALVVSTPEGERVFTLQGGEHPYRALIEQMREGAATLTPEGASTTAITASPRCSSCRWSGSWAGGWRISSRRHTARR